MHCLSASLLAHMSTYCGESRVGSESRNVDGIGDPMPTARPPGGLFAEMVCQSIRRKDLHARRQQYRTDRDLPQYGTVVVCPSNYI